MLGVARQVEATAQIARYTPEMTVIGSAYTYLQEWLPHVAQAVIGAGDASMVGLGRIALSYPHLPDDVLAGTTPDRRLVCRTFSDCTTAPRAGLVSGCYPLDTSLQSATRAGGVGGREAQDEAASSSLKSSRR